MFNAGNSAAPVANDDSATTDEGTPAIIAVLANDSDPDGDPLTVTNLTQPADGAVALNGNDTVTYTPNVGFTGIDSFSYTANDGTSDSNVASVRVTVNTPTSADVVTIIKAEYESKKARLKVEATSSAGGSVTLTAIAYDSSGNVLGSTQLEHDAKKNRHKGRITGLTSKPFRIEVKSTGGGFDFVEGSGIKVKGKRD